MTNDPHGRPGEPPHRDPPGWESPQRGAPSWQPAPHWDQQAPQWQQAPLWEGSPGGHGPSSERATGVGYPPGGPETRAYPPSEGFSWREGGGVPPPRQGPPIGRILLIVGIVLALLAAAAGAYLLISRRPATPAPTPVAQPTAAVPPIPAPAPAPAAAPLTVTASADCVSAPSRDAAGTVVAYGPEQMVDGRPDTAWRCDGDGAGRTVKITFSRRATVTQIGLVPGYAKTDSADGTDRYAQNRRIAQVRYVFDDGTTVEQTLQTGTTTRTLQTVPVPGVTSSGVTVTIVRSVPGNAVGANRPSDRIAISELQVLGTSTA